jgi:hypothetical protein
VNNFSSVFLRVPNLVIEIGTRPDNDKQLTQFLQIELAGYWTDFDVTYLPTILVTAHCLGYNIVTRIF